MYKYKVYIPYIHSFHSIYFHTFLHYIQYQFKVCTLTILMNSFLTLTSYIQSFVNTLNILLMYIYTFPHHAVLDSVTNQRNLSIYFNYIDIIHKSIE